MDKTSRDRRAARVRRTLRRHNDERPRLSVYRSSKHIYVQLIDDVAGRTIVAASTLEKSVRDNGRTGADKEAAQAIGKLVAERAVAAGITDVVFDRGPYVYHGRVQALAEGAREGGLNF